MRNARTVISDMRTLHASLASEDSIRTLLVNEGLSKLEDAGQVVKLIAYLGAYGGVFLARASKSTGQPASELMQPVYDAM